MSIDEQNLLDRTRIDQLDLNLSVGAYENDKLVGFMFSGIGFVEDEKWRYNAGTGVIPNYRGRAITVKMYERLIPVLKEEGIRKSILEVISTNEPAIKSYLRVGYEEVRFLKGYKGSLTGNIEHKIEPVELNWSDAESMWNWKPSWQNSSETCQKANEFWKGVGVVDNSEMIGYSLYDPKTGRIHQFAVHPEYRGKGIGKSLFYFVANECDGNVSTINVDDSHAESLQFLENLGLDNYINQRELILDLS